MMSTSNNTRPEARAGRKSIEKAGTEAAPLDLFEEVERNRRRNGTANAITVVMLLLTVLVLAWVAYQINNPVALNLSALFRR